MLSKAGDTGRVLNGDRTVLETRPPHGADRPPPRLAAVLDTAHASITLLLSVSSAKPTHEFIRQ